MNFIVSIKNVLKLLSPTLMVVMKMIF